MAKLQLQQRIALTKNQVARAKPSHALELDGISVRYGSQVALSGVTATIPRGERLAVVGPNGAGKSTLLKVIAGVLRPSSGRVTTQAKSDALEIAYVPQRSQVDWNFPVSVADVVMMGRTGRIGLLRWPSARDREIVRESLEAVGMTKYAKRQVGELSGGQQQRVFIARALAQQADLMLMDEPLTGLDITSQEDIFSILDQLKQRGVTIIVTIHDLNLAAEHFDRVMLLNHEMIGLGQPDDVFTPERLQKAYGGSMRVIPTNGGVVLLGDSHCGEGHTH